MDELKELFCEACRKGIPMLSEQEIAQYLALLEGWTVNGTTIERTISFKNFLEALAFFNKVAEIAEAEQHHPDMGIVLWKNVHLSLTSHAVHGLTKNDFIVAAKIDALVRS